MRSLRGALVRPFRLLSSDENRARWETAKEILRNPSSRVGIVMIALLAIVGALAPIIAPYSPFRQNLSESLLPPHTPLQ